ADAGQTHDDLDSPAPVVSLTAAQAEGEHGGQSGDQAHGDADGAESADAEQPATSPVPVVLGSAGLAAGIAALIVSIAAYRRRRACPLGGCGRLITAAPVAPRRDPRAAGSWLQGGRRAA